MKDLFERTLQQVIAKNEWHACWLNTLSMMENTGARKISKYEHPVYTNITVLKHAAEEARHAYYLKKQIGKLDETACPDYSFNYLLAPMASYQYLHQLDVQTCRYLKNAGYEGRALYDAAYILVTYAIEVRADELYGTYQDLLSQASAKVTVKSIIAEEAGHLEEMTRMLENFNPQWQSIAADICSIEDKLFVNWINGIAAAIS